MVRSNTAMPATARHGEPASEIELLAGLLDAETKRVLQSRQLARRCAISVPLARAMAPFVFGGKHDA